MWELCDASTVAVLRKFENIDFMWDKGDKRYKNCDTLKPHEIFLTTLIIDHWSLIESLLLLLGGPTLTLRLCYWVKWTLVETISKFKTVLKLESDSISFLFSLINKLLRMPSCHV